MRVLNSTRVSMGCQRTCSCRFRWVTRCPGITNKWSCFGHKAFQDMKGRGICKNKPLPPVEMLKYFSPDLIFLSNFYLIWYQLYSHNLSFQINNIFWTMKDGFNVHIKRERVESAWNQLTFFDPFVGGHVCVSNLDPGGLGRGGWRVFLGLQGGTLLSRRVVFCYHSRLLLLGKPSH